ncbi:Uncharacterised protein [Sphingobacterium spiritivorum]|uniref:Uncharacterized protein n=1 Tax=Sphingobacterium spiritivorum TaxID=258 RepID=A0A380CQ92_SPHSI|nr:hypothetical protein [Sphingobacterium spiritivorum]SUJ26425.1 Uncharacterised protein [Sphingobacterium spiritivorum]
MTLKEQISWCKSQIKAGYHVEVIRSILHRLQAVENKEPPHPFHNQAIAAYKEFLMSYKLPAVIDIRQGKALKELLPKLQGLTATKSPEGAFNALVFIFTNWNRLNDYHQKKKTLLHINQNLVELLDQIRNGANKQQSNVNEAEQLANEIAAKYKTGT